MTTRRPCPPGPLEAYAQQFDPLLASLAQRRGLRDYLQGLLLPRDRNKTLTGLAGAEPIAGAQHRQVQRLQWFLSESTWDHQAVNQQRIHLLQADPATAPHAQGVLVLDDTGDRKDGSATAHVARQYLGSVGKTDNGIVCVTSLDNYGSNVERAAKLHPLWQDGVGGVVGACRSACYSWRRG
jgi:SRSO17 transposase